MKKFLFLALAVLTANIFLVACGSKSEKSEANESHTGTVSVNLDYVYAIALNGAPIPDKDAECKGKFSNYIGKPVETTYDINPQTMIEYAESTFNSMSFKLSALGISGQYTLAIFNPSNFPEAYGVYFTIATNFTNPRSSILFFNGDFNCLLSSQDDLAQSAESSKFSVE